MPSNFSAAYALVFCAGLYLPGRLAWAFPLGVMLVCDLLLSYFFYHSGHYSAWQFFKDQAPNYLAYAALIGLGKSLGPKRSWATLLGGGILGALLFYLITNTAAWLTMPDYAKTFSEWLRALTRGTPQFPPTWEFFRGTLLSGGIFSGLFVGAMKLLEAPEPAPKEEAEAEPEAEGESGEGALAPANAEEK